METWKPVFEYEGTYEVSSLGRVMRCDGYQKVVKPLAPATNHHGYLNVSLCKNCKGRSFFVHRLVARAFIGERPEGFTINHKDGDKKNNRPENLEYVSHKENMRHAHEVLGVITPTRARGDKNWTRLYPEKVVRGEAHVRTKISDAAVAEIRQLLKAGNHQQRELADMFGISQTQIWRYKTNQSRI